MHGPSNSRKTNRFQHALHALVPNSAPVSRNPNKFENKNSNKIKKKHANNQTKNRKQHVHNSDKRKKRSQNANHSSLTASRAPKSSMTRDEFSSNQYTRLLT